MKYFEDQYDSYGEWRQKLDELAHGFVPVEEIPGVITRLGKPLRINRIAEAKDTVLRLGRHPDFLVRSQVVWFCRWGKLTETVPLLMTLLETEQEEIVRDEIERTISYLSITPEKSTVSTVIRRTMSFVLHRQRTLDPND